MFTWSEWKGPYPPTYIRQIAEGIPDSNVETMNSSNPEDDRMLIRFRVSEHVVE